MESQGARLKQVRLEKGISLEEVHDRTKIHITILKAIEEDNLASINPIYMKGFLKIYCKFLGVDPAEYIPNYAEPRAVIRLGKNQPEAEERERPLPAAQAPATMKFRAPNIPWKPIGVAAGVIVAIVLLMQFGKFLAARRKSMDGNPRPAASRVSEKKVSRAAVTQEPEAVKPAETPKPAVASGIRLTLRAKQDCYVQLKTDGHVVFQSILKKGRFENWAAKEKIEASLGNAGAVELEVNGRPIPALGGRGQARKNILITKEGVSVL